MSLLSNALRQHANRLEQAAGERVTYARGTKSNVCVIAVRGRTDFEEILSEGDAEIQAKSLDFIIRRSALTLDGSEVEPQRLDKITTADGQVFEVFKSLDGVHWRWSDEHQTSYRIHTIRREPSQ